MARKPRPEGTRAPNGASSIYYGADGKWHGRVTMGVLDNGKPDRRHIKRGTEGEVITAVRDLERQRDSGKVKKAGRAWTFEMWLTHWVETIAAPSLRYKAATSYRTAVYLHLIPGLGAHKIDRLAPEHFEKLYQKMLKTGRHKPSTIGQIHRTAITALNEAMRRRHVTENPAELARPPKVEESEIEPFHEDEIKRLVKTALDRRNGARFVLALALGTRQGETLGLKWSRLDKSTRTIRITRQLQRQSWQHGCEDVAVCAAKHHKVKPCGKRCRHKRKPCPPPCPIECQGHANKCPERIGGGLVEVEVKSSAGKRGIVLPDELYELLIKHEAQQAAERETAGNEWHEGGWMFAQPNGLPIDPSNDRKDWKAFLTQAGVRDARLHDARHTAATVLLILGVPERAVMEFMGWSNIAMAARYMHVTAPVRRDVARRINGFIWDGD
ncbi:tyrosine-type recombinase/integrase [Lentzea cavernae]|uniref:Site-specific integrase n=1 Tax=Lentzea cavernae TaxID=2020703 RepID=A0ABQ3MS60_9PSEU|nr:site-specific integrase [Lentzea cavernae]GHH56998.1 site-specific integrase [Lentzea cavernae]